MELRFEHMPFPWLCPLVIISACTLPGCAPEAMVMDDAPQASFQEPAEGAQLIYGQVTTFRATVSDDLSPAGSLDALWESDLDGVLASDPPYDAGEGASYAAMSTGRLSPGQHLVTLSLMDPAGNIGSVSVSVTVTRNHEPQASITSPLGETFDLGQEVDFQASVSDEDQDVSELQVRWYSSIDGLLDSSPPTGSGLASFSSTGLSAGEHQVTLLVTDDLGDVAVQNSGVVVLVSESCNGSDDDGDGYVDEGFDVDGDGLPDCQDAETCDGVDNDGDGYVDEGFEDADGDGIMDCVDQEDPDEPADCDGLDNDGDGQTDEGFQDADGDGLKDCVDQETCGDLVDNDGDGLVDEDCP